MSNRKRNPERRGNAKTYDAKRRAGAKISNARERAVQNVRNRKTREMGKMDKKLNVLDKNKATRTFYSELKSQCLVEEQAGPIANREGKLSTTLSECLEHWRDY